MGDTEPSNKMFFKTKHTKSNILSHGVGVDSVATSYFIG